MPSDSAETRPFMGFHSYADDTPRADDPAPEPHPPPVAGWAETPAWREMGDDGDTADAARPAWPKIAAMSGAVIGLLTAAFGWGALQARKAPMAEPVAAPVAPAATSPQMRVVVTDPPPPPPVPKTSERLEVLPKGPAAAPSTPAPSAHVPLAQALIPVAPAPGVGIAEQPPDPLPHAAPSVTEAARNASAPAGPAPRRYNDCADAPTRAMAMVCRDMRLAEADRRMKRAYRAALAAGVPEAALAQDQADWLEVREDAARVSRHAVADIYRQRTRELQAMAGDGRD